MSDEQKITTQEGKQSSCGEGKNGGKGCCCCRGRCWGRVLLALLLAAAGYGLFHAGRCSAQHCAPTSATATMQK